MTNAPVLASRTWAVLLLVVAASAVLAAAGVAGTVADSPELRDPSTGDALPERVHADASAVSTTDATSAVAPGAVAPTATVGASSAPVGPVLAAQGPPGSGAVTIDHDPSELVVGLNATFVANESAQPGGTIHNLSWDFDGDGDSERVGENVTYAFEENGTHTVELLVEYVNSSSETVTENVSVVEDERPTARFDYAPATPLVGDPVTLNASDSSDPVGTITSYEWEVAGDADVEGSGANATVSFEEAGNATVTLTVTDDGDNQHSTTRTIEVEARPIATFEANPQSSIVGEDVTFDASASSDPDGIAAYEWTFAGDETVNTTAANVTHSFEQNGTFPVVLTVSDDAGNSNSTNRTIEVRTNESESDESLAADFTYDRQEPTAGMNVTFDASNSTVSERNSTSYEWTFAGNETATANGTKATHRFENPGTFNVTLRLVDEGDESDTLSKNITVQRRITADIEYSPGVPVIGQPVAFEVSNVTGSDGNLTGYEWTFPGNRTANTSHANYSFPDNGTYTVELTVTEDGRSATTNATVAVNAPPVADFEYSPTNVSDDQRVSFNASSASDPDGSITRYEWTIGNDTTFNTTNATTERLFEDPDEYLVELVVYDNQSATNSTTETIDVRSSESPSVTFDYDPETLIAGQKVTFEATNVSGLEGNVTYAWTFSANSTVTTTNVTLNHTFEEANSFNVSLEVRNGDGLVASTIQEVNVMPNRPPSADFDSPRTAAVDTSVSFNASSSSDEGNITEYEWTFRDNTTINTTDPSIAHTFGSYGTYNVTLRVTDEYGEENVTSRRIEIQAPPTATFSYDPEPVKVGQATTFDASDASDADGNSMSYAWDFDGDGNFSEATDEAVVTYEFNSSGNHTVSLRVEDDDGNENSTNRTIDVSADPGSDDDSDDDDDGGSDSSGGGGLGGTGGFGPSPSPSTAVTTTPLGGGNVHVAIRNPDRGSEATVGLAPLYAGDVTVEELGVTAATSGDELSFDVRTSGSAPAGVSALASARALGYVAIADQQPTDGTDGVELRFDVSASALPEGTDREDVRLYAYDGGEWTERETERDATGFSASAAGPSSFAVGVPAPDVAVTNATVGSTTVVPGQATTVTATARNDGSVGANQTFELATDGGTLDARTLSIPPGESRTMTFEPSFEDAGTYDLSVGAADAGTVTVSSDSSDDGGGFLLPLLGVVLAVLAVAGVLVAERHLDLWQAG